MRFFAFAQNDIVFTNECTKAVQMSKSEMAKAAVDMQKSSRVQLDTVQFKKLTEQIHKLQGEAQKARLKLINMVPGSDNAKALGSELRDIEKQLRLVTKAAEPTRRALERMAKTGDSAFKLSADKAASFGKTMSMYVTAPIIAAGAAAIKAATDTGAYAEQMLNLAQKTGVSTQRLQELKVISENAGLSFDTVSTAITQVQRKLMGIEEGSGPAADAMAALGISIKGADGNLRSMDEIFPEIIKKLQGMQNVTERNMLAAQIFGRGFGELAPILGMTADQMDAAAKRANELGLVMSGDALNSAAAFDDAMDDLKQRIAGMIRVIATQVIPVLQDVFIPVIIKMVDWIKRMADRWNNLSPGVKGFVTAMLSVIAIVGPLIFGLGQIVKAVQVLREAWVTMAAVQAAVTKGPTLLPSIAAAVAVAIAGMTALSIAEAKAWNSAPKKMDTPDSKSTVAAMTDADSVWSQYTAKQDAEEEAKKAAKTDKKNGKSQSGGLIDRLQQTAIDSLNSGLKGYVDNLSDTLSKQRQWAADMAASMRQFSSDTLDAVKDQLRKEQDERDKAADTAKSRYEKLSQLGAAGAAAMTNIVMFGKDKEKKDFTAADITPDRVSAAAKAVAAGRANESAMSGLVNKQLYGDSIGRFEAASKGTTPDMAGASVGQQVNLLTQVVQKLDQQLCELVKINHPPVTSRMGG